MHFEVQGIPRFSFLLTEEQVLLLVNCSANHYDSKCREASKQGGIIYQWGRRLLWNAEDNTPGHWKMEANSSDLDLCLKILEYPAIPSTVHEKALQWQLFNEFRQAHQQAQILWKLWTTTFEAK
jgi:hypothetical protein